MITRHSLSTPYTLAISIGFFIVATLLGSLLFRADAGATAKASDFDAGNIIDDVVFYNDGSMTAAQIQTFLNAKVPTCDTNGTASASDWGYPNLTHAQMASYIRSGTNGFTKDTGFHAPPYTCTKDYRQNTPQMEAASGLCEALSAKSNRSAANIIKDVASACGINPQVLIILLQKEQSLISDTWPLNRQFKSATGFACSDSAPCDSSYSGFFYQVYYAARQFKIYKAYPTNYSYIAGRTNRIYWQTNLGNWLNSTGNYSSSQSTCGYSNVYIKNQATAALYIYTPYRPNKAALNNLYGTGDACSAYGNRNFWRMFTDWFGSTNFTTSGGIGNKYESLGGRTGWLGSPTSNEICGLKLSGCYQTFEKGYIYWTASTGAQSIGGGIRSLWKTLLLENGTLGYPTSDEISTAYGAYQLFQNGRIYWTSAAGAVLVHGGIGNKYIALGAENSALGVPTGSEDCSLVGPGCVQRFTSGQIYWTSKTGAHPVRAAIYNKWISLASYSGTLGYPTSDENSTAKGTFQQFEKGRIYWSSTSGAVNTHGSIGNRYVALGGHAGKIGFPLSEEACSTLEGGAALCAQSFENGSIMWRGDKSVELIGEIKALWDQLGGAESHFGYPVSGENILVNGIYQQFQNGRIYWKSGVGAKSIHGGIGNRYISLGAEKSKLGYPTSNETVTGSTTTQQFEKGTIAYDNTTGKVTVTYNN